MAKKYYEGDITMDTDWGGKIDEQGNETQLPLSGKQVQGFIKDTFNSKVGYVDICETTGMYVMTKDKETFTKYNDLVIDGKYTEAEKYKIAEFKAPYEYAANIEFIDPEYGYKAVSSNDKDITISFRVFTKDSSGALYDESYTGTISSRNGGSSQSRPINIKEKAGIVTLNIDDIIAKGENEVTVNIKGMNSGVSAFQSVTIKVIALNLTPKFNISKVYNTTNSNQTLYCNYGIELIGASTVHFFINYQEVGVVPHTFNTDAGSYQYGFSKNTLETGVNCLMCYASYNDGKTAEDFTTPIYYYEFFVDNGDVFNETFISTSYVIPYDKDFIAQKKQPYISNAEQYSDITIPFAIYNSGTETQVRIELAEGNSDEFILQDTINTYNGEVTNYNVIISQEGNATIKIVADETELEIGPFYVSPSTIQILPVTDNLVLDFWAKGKENGIEGYDSWVSNVNGKKYEAIFNDFSWTTRSGWDNGRLSIANGTSVEIPYRLLASNTTIFAGMTFEFEFSTKNVYDDNAIVCQILNGANEGIILTASEAKFVVKEGVEVTTKFKSGENNRITFVIMPKNDDPNYRGNFVKIYVNGVLCGVAKYDNSSSWANDSHIIFTGSETVEIELYAIRCYEKALTNDEIVDNYIFYRPTQSEKNLLYYKNNIYTDGEIDIEKLSQHIPVMIFYQKKGEGKLEDLETEYSEKDRPVIFDIQYIHNLNPELNFTIENAYVTPQGTSSMKYPRKNFRIYTNKYEGTILYDFNNNQVEDRKYSFTIDERGEKVAARVDCWCLKADFAESSGTHNTGTARYWNTVLTEAGLLTKAQEKAKKAKYNEDVRTTIDGFPIVLMYQEYGQKKPRLVGKYNFNNDKSTEHVFGFTGGPIVEDKEIKYVPIGKIKPQFNKTEEKKNLGAYSQNPTENSPLFAKDASGMYYMLQTKKMFDNPKMECWEILTSSSELAMFITTDGWAIEPTKEKKIGLIVDGEFSEAFESRFPDSGKHYNVNELKRFCEWVVSCRYLKVNEDCTVSEMSDEELFALNNEQTLTIKSLTKHTGFDNYQYINRNGVEVPCNFFNGMTFRNTAEYRKLKFEIEKYDYLDIEKVAAYYIYLMRFGGVDQTVKNAMLTTEGPADENNYDLPSLWYFINYDNDTILGVKNTGELRHGPYISRSTFEEGTTTPAYAGRESTLWNNLENDSDFMTIHVHNIDEQLHVSTNGLSYENAINMYNVKQAEQWCERIMNLDAQTKYIDTYISPSSESMKDENVAENEFLVNIQGPRMEHRKWWLAKRFNIYDGYFGTGDFTANSIQIKISKFGVDKNLRVTVGEDTYLAYTVNNKIAWKTDRVIKAGEECKVKIPATIDVGNPVSLHGGVNIKILDLSEVAAKLNNPFDMGGAYDKVLGSKLIELKVGDKDNPFLSENSGLQTIANLGLLEKLEMLDITGMQYISNLNGLSNLKNLKKLYTAGSNVGTINFTEGGLIEEIEVSTKTNGFDFNELNNLTWDNIVFYDIYQNDSGSVVKEKNNSYGKLRSLTIKNSPKLLSDYKPILEWLNIKKETNESINTFDITLEGINWVIPYSKLNELWVLENVRTKEDRENNLRGTITIVNDNDNKYATLTQDDVDKLIEIFGDKCFSTGSMHINCAPYIFINGVDTILEGDSNYNTYKIIRIGSIETNITVTLHERLRDEKIDNIVDPDDKDDGIEFEYDKKLDIIKVKLDEVKRDIQFLTIRASFSLDGPSTNVAKLVTVNKREYPISVVISGDTSIDTQYKEVEYKAICYGEGNNADLNGNFTIAWELSGEAYDNEYVSIISTDKDTCVVKTKELFNSKFTIHATVKRILEGDTIIVCTNSFEVGIKDKSVFLIPEDNPALFWLLYDNGFVNNDKKITYEEINSISLNTTSNGVSFGNLFTNVTGVTHDNITYPFNSFDELKSFPLISNIPDAMFSGCTKLEKITLNGGGGAGCSIGNNAFTGTKLNNIKLPNDLTSIGEGAFSNCSSLTNVEIPDSVTTLGKNVFKGCSKLETLSLGNGIKEIPTAMCSGCEKLVSVTHNDTIEKIGSEAFNECTKLQSFNIPQSLTTIDFKSKNPFTMCYVLEFTGGNDVYPVEDGTLYFNDLSNGKKWVIKQNPTKQIKGDEKLYLANHSLNGMAIDVVDIDNNVTISGENILIGAQGKDVYIRKLIKNHDNCVGLFAKANFDNYHFATNETIIPSKCFLSGTTLTNIELPNTITEIGEYAFNYCNNLTSITIPASVKTMGKHVFSFQYNSQSKEHHGLEQITMLPASPPSIEIDLFQNVGNIKFIVDGDSYESYANHEIWSRYTKFIKMNTLPSNGYFRIIKDKNIYFSTNGDSETTIGEIVSDVTIGGVSPKQHHSGYYEFNINNTNKMLDIKLYEKGVWTTIGTFTKNYQTIYVGDNKSLYGESPKGIDFSKGIWTVDNLPNGLLETKGDWYVDTEIGGLRTPKVGDVSKKYTMTLNFKNFQDYADENGKIKLKFGQISESKYDYAKIENNKNELNNFKETLTYGKEILIDYKTSSFDFIWIKDSSNSYYLDCFWIESIGNPVYNDPQLNSGHTVNIKLKVTTPFGNPRILNDSVIEVSNGTYYKKEFKLNLDDKGYVTLRLPKDENMTFILKTFNVNSKIYYAPEPKTLYTDSDKEIQMDYFCYQGMYYIDNSGNVESEKLSGKNYIAILNADETSDTYILKDTSNEIWKENIDPQESNYNLSYTNDDQWQTKNTDGLINSRQIYDVYPTSAIAIKKAIGISTLNNIIEWYLPSCAELYMLIQNEEIQKALISIGSTPDTGVELWTSNISDIENAFAVKDNEIIKRNRKESHKIRIIGRKKI